MPAIQNTILRCRLRSLRTYRKIGLRGFLDSALFRVRLPSNSALFGILFALGIAGCDAPKEKSPDAYFTPLFENKSIAVAANQPSEQILEVKPALCYRIFGEASVDPVTVTVVDDGGAPVRTTNSENGKFEIGQAHGFCTRVIKGPYYVRLSSKTDATVKLTVSKSQSGGI